MKKTILLIEEDLLIIEVYTIAFKKANFNVIVKTSGYDVLEWLKGNKTPKPSIILLNLILSDAKGPDLLREIRKDKELKDTPLFILTNYTQRQLQELGYDLKSENYLTKTEYTPTLLVKIIKERLKE